MIGSSDTSATNISDTVASLKKLAILSIYVDEVKVNLVGLVIRGKK